MTSENDYPIITPAERLEEHGGDLSHWELFFEEDIKGFINAHRRIVVSAQVLGALSYDLNGDAEDCRNAWYVAGQFRLTYLKEAERRGGNQYHYGTSDYHGLVAAIAAGDFNTAKSIANNTPQAYRPGGYDQANEYVYGRFLAGLLLDSLTPDDALALATQYTDYIGETPRLQLCLAIFHRDQDQLDESLKAFMPWKAALNRWLPALSEQERDDDQENYRQTIDENARAAISIDAIALLQLAKLRGLDPKQSNAANSANSCPEELLNFLLESPYPA